MIKKFIIIKKKKKKKKSHSDGFSRKSKDSKTFKKKNSAEVPPTLSLERLTNSSKSPSGKLG
jgi:hypothetical protein